MRFIAVLMFFSAVLLLGGGCGKHYKMIHGIRYEVLSPEEENEMKSMARVTLAKSKALSAKERELIKTIQPELKIRYSGDRTGDASVSWQLPTRTVTLFMRGVFFDSSSQWMMKIRNKQPEYLDLRPRFFSR
ncbi:MAG: hypothetical protein IKC05_06945 [Lentisphaeria bacterium]|nr:hypothetical protein [Lentisphaeria bacterium]